MNDRHYDSAVRCAKRVSFDNDEESFIKLCYSLEDKIANVVDTEIKNYEDYYIDRDMAIHDVQSSIYMYLRSDTFAHGKYESKFYHMCYNLLSGMAHDAVSDQMNMDGISDVEDYGSTVGFTPLSIDEIKEAELLDDIISQFQEVVTNPGRKRSKYKIGMCTFSKREMQVVALYLGFTPNGEMSYKQIGKRYKICGARVSQIYNKAIRKFNRAIHFLAHTEHYFVGSYVREDEVSAKEKIQSPGLNNDRRKSYTPIRNCIRTASLSNLNWIVNGSVFIIPDKYEYIQNFTGNLEIPDLEQFVNKTNCLCMEKDIDGVAYLSFRSSSTTQYHAYPIDEESFLKNTLCEVSYKVKRQVFIRAARDYLMSIVIYINKDGEYVWSFVPPYHIRFEVQRKGAYYSTRVVAYRIAGTFVGTLAGSFFDKDNDPNPYRSIVSMYGKAIIVSEETITVNPPDAHGDDEVWMKSAYDNMVEKVSLYQQVKE